MLYLQNKHQIAQTLLATNQTVRVVLDSRVAEVDIPDNLLNRDQVVLDIGLRMAVPIPDLYISAQGFCGTLMFRGCPRYVFVPWTAVYSIYLPDTGRGAVWGKDMPEGVKGRLVADARSRAEVGTIPASKTFNYPPAGGKVVSLDEFRARRQAKKDGLS